MFQLFAQRSYRPERLDTGDYTAQEYALWQKEMKLINRFLGDTRALRLELKDEMNGRPETPVSILDVGAGAGTLLKAATGLRGKDVGGMFVGAELNHEAAKSINALKTEFGISAVECDALKLPFADDSFDFVVTSLFLHHLNDSDALTLVNEMSRVARNRFFIIDLHRHAGAYYLYRTFGPLLFQGFTIEDGSLSILKSFRPAELLQLAQKAGISDAVVKRRLVFRLSLSGGKAVQPL